MWLTVKHVWNRRKHCWRRTKCWLHVISSFPTMLSKVGIMWYRGIRWNGCLDLFAKKDESIVFCIAQGISYLYVKFLLFYPFNPFPNKPWFFRVCNTSLLKTLREKEKSLVTSNFSFSHSVFYPFGKFSAIFIKLKIVVCKPSEFGRV